MGGEKAEARSQKSEGRGKHVEPPYMAAWDGRGELRVFKDFRDFRDLKDFKDPTNRISDC